MAATARPAASHDGKIDALKETLISLANEQHQSAEFQRLFAARFTRIGAQQYFLQHAQFNLNRRDCWGYVQGAAPMAVKRLVWEHEEGELAGDKTRGVADHFTLAVKQGAAFGLTPDDYKNTVQMIPSPAALATGGAEEFGSRRRPGHPRTRQLRPSKTGCTRAGSSKSARPSIP
jgi:hypothetical protein